jgi:hypothetical protein
MSLNVFTLSLDSDYDHLDDSEMAVDILSRLKEGDRLRPSHQYNRFKTSSNEQRRALHDD